MVRAKDRTTRSETSYAGRTSLFRMGEESRTARLRKSLPRRVNRHGKSAARLMPIRGSAMIFGALARSWKQRWGSAHAEERGRTRKSGARLNILHLRLRLKVEEYAPLSQNEMSKV